MTVDDDCDAQGVPAQAPGGAFRLDRAVASLYEDLRLTPLLHTLLAQSRLLVGGVAGSISVVDPRSGTYSKLAERGVPCRLGQRFSLADGATGQAFARRRPVVIDDYSALPAGHLPPGHAATSGSVTAVPIWWRGDLIGVNVTFAGRRRQFSTAEIDQLEVLTQTAAGAIVTAGAGEPSLGRLIREQMEPYRDQPGGRTVLTEVGAVAPVSPAVAEAAVGLVRSVQRTTARGDSATPLHVAILYRSGGIRVLVQADDVGLEPWAGEGAGQDGDGGSRRLLSLAGGAADVEHVAGWGTLLRADIPYSPAQPAPASRLPTPEPSPLTSREAEVLVLVARGWGDREIGRALVVSPRTVEKHVGAALRKTGATSRTGAAMRALERGWLTT